MVPQNLKDGRCLEHEEIREELTLELFELNDKVAF